MLRLTHASITTLDWTINAYTLTFAVLMTSAVTLGDRWGRRPVYTGGLLLFTLSSAFTATGGYRTVGDVASGYRAAMLLAACFAALGLAVALTAPLRRPARRGTPADRLVSTAGNAR